jgi:FkbM family methyltransferase
MPPSIDRKLLRTIACRYGRLTVPVFDTTIGKSLEFYGEWGQKEIELLLALLPPGGAVLDVGAYVGTHTLAFAQRVGAHGSVWACEPRPAIFALLLENVTQNALENVELLHCAFGREGGRLRFPRVDFSTCRNFGAGAVGSAADTLVDRVEMRALDDLELDRLDLVKVDVEGMEADVLRGAEAALGRFRPSLYLECSSAVQGREILEVLLPFSFRVFCHRPAAFNPINFQGSSRSIFGRERETALLAVAAEKLASFEDVLGSEILVPIENHEQLAAQLAEGRPSEQGTLGAKPGETRFAIESVNGLPFDSLPVDSEGRREIALEDVGLLLTGWAVAQKESAGGVLVRVGSESLEADFGFPRKDLAELHRDGRFLRSGFAFSVPRLMVAAGEFPVEIVILSGDRTQRFGMPEVVFHLV